MPIYKGDTPIVEASGRKGKDGKDGINGENGATYTPSISEEGILSWTNDKNLPNPEPVNVKGQDGVSYTLTKSEDGTKIILTGSDGSVQEILDSNTTYSEATQTESGLMSKEDKAKLDNMSSGGGGNVTFTSEIIFEGQTGDFTKTLDNFDSISVVVNPTSTAVINYMIPTKVIIDMLTEKPDKTATTILVFQNQNLTKAVTLNNTRVESNGVSSIRIYGHKAVIDNG